MFGAKHEDVGLNTQALQFLHRVLCRLGFEFACGSYVWHISQMDAKSVVGEFPAELANGFEKRLTLDVAHGATYFGDNEVVVARFAQEQHIALYFVGDVRDNLHCFAQIFAAAFALNHILVDTTGGDVVGASGANAGKALIVTEVEVGLLTVDGYIAFAMFIGVERAGVDIDIGVELLNGYLIASRLE